MPWEKCTLSVLNNFDSLLPIQFQFFIILNLIVPVETLIKLVNMLLVVVFCPWRTMISCLASGHGMYYSYLFLHWFSSTLIVTVGGGVTVMSDLLFYLLSAIWCGELFLNQHELPRTYMCPHFGNAEKWICFSYGSIVKLKAVVFTSHLRFACVLMLLCICISINLADFNRMECFVIRNRECWHCASKDIHLGIWGLWQEALCPYMPLMLLVQKGFQMPLGFEFSHVPVYYPLAWVSIFWMCVVCPVQWPRISCRLTF